jgi:general secretion pathway protein D
MVQPGQIARISQVREFIYPTEYDPPEIPNDLGFIQLGGVRVSVPVTEFPAVPATPTAFEMRELGGIIEVEPTVSSDNRTINLNVLADFTEFGGFINYGTPIRNVILQLNDGSPSTVTENRILMPVFDAIKETTNVTIWDGNTIAIGGYISESVTGSEDKIPFVGDLPVVGKAFRSKTRDATKRALIIFVQAELVDPGGNSINAPPIDEEPELFTRQDTPVKNVQPVGPPPAAVYPTE